MQPAQSSIHRGQSALWTVTAWTTGGNVPDATIRLTATPASLKPTFSFGCGTHDGTASCDLGALDASSAQRQLQAKVAVAATATTVTSVRLTAAENAAHVSKDPQVSSATTVTAAPAATSSSSADPTTPGTTISGVDTSPLSVGDLPGVSTSASPLLSPGGNASGLFPSLTPSADPPGKSGTGKASGRTIANTAALPLGAPVVGAQLAGLGVLALAFVLAIARLSIRRRPATAQAGTKAGAASADPPTLAGPPKPDTGPPPAADADTEPNAEQNPADPVNDDPPEA